MKRLLILTAATLAAFIYTSASAQSKKEEKKQEKKVTKDVQVTTDKKDNSMKVVTIINGDTTTKEFTFNEDDIQRHLEEAGKELEKFSDDFGKELSYAFNIDSNDDDNSVVISSGGKITKIIIETDEEKSDKKPKHKKVTKKVIVNDDEDKDNEVVIVKAEAKSKNKEEKKEKIVKKEIRHTASEASETSTEMQRSDVRFDDKDNTLMIDFWLPSKGEADVKVEDADGKVLYDKKIEGRNAQYNREVQLKEKPRLPLRLSVKQENFEIEKIK